MEYFVILKQLAHKPITCGQVLICEQEGNLRTRPNLRTKAELADMTLICGQYVTCGQRYDLRTKHNLRTNVSCGQDITCGQATNCELIWTCGHVTICGQTITSRLAKRVSPSLRKFQTAQKSRHNLRTEVPQVGLADPSSPENLDFASTLIEKFLTV